MLHSYLPRATYLKNTTQIRHTIFIAHLNHTMASSTKLTPSERQACSALSTLFLDTEIDIGPIISQLRPLQFPIPDLERILRYDVFPVVYTNLLNPAGEWAGFEDDWLCAEIEARRGRGGYGIVDTLAWNTVGRMIQPSWTRIKSALGARL